MEPDLHYNFLTMERRNIFLTSEEMEYYMLEVSKRRTPGSAHALDVLDICHEEGRVEGFFFGNVLYIVRTEEGDLPNLKDIADRFDNGTSH